MFRLGLNFVIQVSGRYVSRLSGRITRQSAPEVIRGFWPELWTCFGHGRRMAHHAQNGTSCATTPQGEKPVWSLLVDSIIHRSNALHVTFIHGLQVRQGLDPSAGEFSFSPLTVLRMIPAGVNRPPEASFHPFATVTILTVLRMSLHHLFAIHFRTAFASVKIGGRAFLDCKFHRDVT